MKDYDPGTWGLTFIFSLEGSVFPRAFCIAFPNACIALGTWYLWREEFAKDIFEEGQKIDVGQIWILFNFIIGFAVTFRAQRAYSRWWEGGTLLQQARGEWFNGYSSLIAFCTRDASKNDLVMSFQHSVSRLISMLHASALMSVSTDAGIDFEVIDAAGISDAHLEFLRGQEDKCEIIMQWIQRLIVDNMENGCLPIPPPVISRVFQELSRGIVNIHNVRKITEFQFPFPFAQMIMCTLIVQWVSTPLVCGLLLETPVWAALLSFFPTFAAWGINFIAAEIEQPFGTDANDMPMHFMQSALNKSVLSLLEREAQEPPRFDMKLADVQTLWHEPSKSAPQSQNNDTRSVAYLTVQDCEQLHRISRRFQGRIARRSPAYDATVARLSRKGSDMKSEQASMEVSSSLGSSSTAREVPSFTGREVAKIHVAPPSSKANDDRMALGARENLLKDNEPLITASWKTHMDTPTHPDTTSPQLRDTADCQEYCAVSQQCSVGSVEKSECQSKDVVSSGTESSAKFTYLQTGWQTPHVPSVPSPRELNVVGSNDVPPPLHDPQSLPLQ